MRYRPRPQVHWRQAGTGPPLVLLNGWTASGLAWPRAWVRALESRYRVVRVDNRGSGFSRFADTPFSVRDMADDVVAVLDETGHESATILGLSMGGMVAQELALAHPSRVRALVLVATRPPSPAHVLPGASSLLGDLLRPPRRGERLDGYMRRLWGSALGEGFVEREPAALEELVAQIVARPTTRAMLMHQLRAVSGWGHAERLAGIDVPTLVVHGAADRFIEPVNGRRLAELIPGARLVELDGVGHLPPIEAPQRLLGLVDELTASCEAERQRSGRRHAGLPPASAA